MIQLILEQLVYGTPLAAISPKIAFQASLAIIWVKFIEKELPSINFIRHAKRFLELLMRPLQLIILGRWSNGINYSLMSRAVTRMLSIIWSYTSSMRNVCIPSYSQPKSSWRERHLISRLKLWCQSLWAVGSGCSVGRRCWSTHNFRISTISHTQAL